MRARTLQLTHMYTAHKLTESFRVTLQQMGINLIQRESTQQRLAALIDLQAGGCYSKDRKKSVLNAWHALRHVSHVWKMSLGACKHFLVILWPFKMTNQRWQIQPVIFPSCMNIFKDPKKFLKITP